VAAAGNRHLADATLLVDRTPDLGPALAEAAGAGFLDLVKRLLARKASPDAVDRTDASALERAARAGHLDVVATLLDAGASVTVTASRRYAPRARTPWTWSRVSRQGVPCRRAGPVEVHAAPERRGRGLVEVVALLLARGADPRAVDAEGRGYAVYMEVRQSFYTAELDRLAHALGTDRRAGAAGRARRAQGTPRADPRAPAAAVR
jgi:hypothetical protein